MFLHYQTWTQVVGTLLSATLYIQLWFICHYCVDLITPIFQLMNVLFLCSFQMQGIMHETKPFFTAQFHPEHKGGPTDTEVSYLWTVTYQRGGGGGSWVWGPQPPPPPKKVTRLYICIGWNLIHWWGPPPLHPQSKGGGGLLGPEAPSPPPPPPRSHQPVWYRVKFKSLMSPPPPSGRGRKESWAQRPPAPHPPSHQPL